MHGHHTYQPLKRRGLTLVELSVGIALAGVVALVSVGLFKAGLKSYNYSYRQMRMLTSARKALAGDGTRSGMIQAVQSAVSVDALSVSSLAVTPAGDFPTIYFVGDGGLYTSRLATQALQAEAVSSMTVSYYNMDADGHIIVATAPASAAFATAQITMKGALASDKEYSFMSGAMLHNKP